MAAGNLQRYMPFLLKEIDVSPKKQYLLLHSLKEVSHPGQYYIYNQPSNSWKLSNFNFVSKVISCQSTTAKDVEALKPFINSIW